MAIHAVACYQQKEQTDENSKPTISIRQSSMKMACSATGATYKVPLHLRDFVDDAGPLDPGESRPAHAAP